jgi:soluble lytic murein transglycosylase
VPYQAFRILICLFLLCAVDALADVSTQSAAADLSRARRDYADAVQAIKLGQWAQYGQLRAALENYPLGIYLDYFQLMRQLEKVRPEEALGFLQRSAATPLPNRFLSAYLREAGKDQRWRDFLQVMSGEPKSVDLKCYYFRAQLAQGDKALAWQGARRLWVIGESQPPPCDPLFDAWLAEGGLTDDIVWTRLLNVFPAEQPALLHFVAQKGSPQLTPWSEKLLAAYDHPEALADLSLPVDNPYSADIASLGLVRLAGTNPEQALSYWNDIRRRLPFSVEQARRVEHAIALQGLFARTATLSDWLDGALVRLGDDKLVGIRLRWALAEQDWAGIERYLPLLSEAARQDNVWRYWQAIAQQRRGDQQAATAALERLAGERDYYGFLAADDLGRPYTYNNQQLVRKNPAPVSQLQAVLRVEELTFHEEGKLAQSEWTKLLQDTTERGAQQDLALLAAQRGWYRMAIDAATLAQAWDALDLRFPTPFESVFKRYAAAQHVPRTELLAIARRESAFFPDAESPAGARGLMQVMPATGEVVASTLQQPQGANLFDVDDNVLLGSAYYRQLLDRFDGNRIFALAAYNAGPQRVERWRQPVGEGVPAEVWIETIPYLETRQYVQAVLAYNVVFQYLLGDTQALLTPLERRARY